MHDMYESYDHPYVDRSKQLQRNGNEQRGLFNNELCYSECEPTSGFYHW